MRALLKDVYLWWYTYSTLYWNIINQNM